MESSENRLGGGPPSPEVAQGMEDQLDRVVQQAEAAFGAQEASTPTEPSAPIKIDREDLLEYKLLGSRASYAELQVTMYTRELQRSQGEANQIGFEASELLTKLGAKYGVDMRANKVTDDGYLVPRVPLVRR